MRVSAVGNGQLVIRSQAVRTASAPAGRGVVHDALGRDAVALMNRIQRNLVELQRLRPTAAVRRTTEASLGAATSTQAIGLNVVPQAAVLRSTGAITVQTASSYSPTSPTWSGLSLGQPTIGGTYDGSQGDDTLTAEVTQANGAGAGNRRVEVRDSAGNLIEEVRIQQNDPPGEVYDLPNGLTLSFGPGPTFQGDTFTFDVDDGEALAVDPDAAFDGGGTPLNFGGGQEVVAGSFDVNGVTIAVAADDTINSVIAAINASPAGVTAAFDVGTGTVVLTHDTVGSAGDIQVDQDDSGFLAAMNLEAAVLEPGADDQLAGAVLRDVPAFSTISNGDIGIGPTLVRVRRSSDTLADVLARIEAEAPGVSAGYVLSTDRVTLDAATVLDLDEGTTGFFTALHITPGPYFGPTIGVSRGAKGIAISDRREINGTLRRIAGDLNDLLALSDVAPTFVAGFRDAIVGVFEQAEADHDLSAIGLRLQISGSRPQIRYGDIGARRLERSLRDEPADALRALFGDEGSDAGVLAELESAVVASMSIAERLHGFTT